VGVIAGGGGWFDEELFILPRCYDFMFTWDLGNAAASDGVHADGAQ
jgi:hypothetical protein